MTIEELIVYGKKYLPSIEAKMLLIPITGYDTLNLLNHLDELLDEEKVNNYKKLIEARLADKPVQYILGNTVFYGLELFVNEDVLIPRFETEELVENTIKLIKTKFNKKLKVLDLCCGSGAIGLAIKSKVSNVDLTMSDISSKALAITKKNCDNLKMTADIIESDLFQNITGKFDVIISNPPYIAKDEKIDDLVKNNEPSLALYAEQGGLEFYERILKDIEKYLNKEYIIALEIGCTQKNQVIDIINKYLKNVTIISKQDLSERDRMIFILNN